MLMVLGTKGLRMVSVVGALALATTVVAQEPEYVAIKAGRVITVSGDEFSPGVIVIEDGKITAVGAGLEFPASAEVINAQGQTVMPGFVHPRTRYDLEDFTRSGVHGDQTAASEVYIDRIGFDELREAGFTTACFVPAGKGIPGMASVYRTGGDEDTRLVKEAGYLHVNAAKKSVLRDALKKAKAEIEKVEKARKEWEEKQKKKKEEAKKNGKDKPEKEDGEPDKDDKGNGKSVPGRAADDGDDEGGGEPKPATDDKAVKEKAEDTFKPPPVDPKYQPLVDLIEKKDGARMMVQLREASDLLHLDEVLERYEDLSYTLYLATRRSTDYRHIVDKLGKRKAQLVIRPWMHYLPQTTFRYNLISDLVEAECEVSVVPFYDTKKELNRVRERLADLVRAGLKKEDAYKMLTLHPATLIGLGEKIGSIEKDRDADLVFFDGDPLDPHSTVRRVMILGDTVYNADEDE